MNTYIITEKQNRASTRKGKKIEAASLAAAKSHASRDQMFQGSVLTIEDEEGELLATKENDRWGGCWTNE